MEEKLGQVVLNAFENIWLSLKKIDGKPHLELRMYGHVTPTDPKELPGREAIVLPVNLLPVLVRVLTQAQESLIKRGLVFVPRPAEATIVENGEPLKLRLDNHPSRADSRRSPRVRVNLSVECRLLDPNSFWPTRPVAGEVKDVSFGGAQAWLPKRLPRFKQVEITMAIDGNLFRGRAEIVGAEMESNKDPKTGHYRHSLRWMVMDGGAKATLSQIVSPR